MPAERVLSRGDLNRAVLARQILLERTGAPLPRVLERMGGLQAQYAPSMYVGLWSRTHRFERDALTRALERRTVVQATLMRSTIHLVSRRDYWPMALAVRDARRQSALRADKQLDDRRMTAAAETVRGRLSAGPLHRREIEELIGKLRTRYIGLWVDLVRVPPSGTWERRRADVYALAEQWLGAPQATAEDGVELLVRRYLAAFGPATRSDIADWAGLPAAAIEPPLEQGRLRRFRSEDGVELLDLPRAELPDADAPAPVRFLPTWDATLLVHARRTGILPEEHRPRIFTARNPSSESTFLVDGQVAGTWRHQDGRIAIEPFGRLDAATRCALDEEARGLAAH